MTMRVEVYLARIRCVRIKAETSPTPSPPNPSGNDFGVVRNLDLGSIYPIVDSVKLGRGIAYTAISSKLRLTDLNRRKHEARFYALMC